ncbi:MAG: hypothetical protein RL549_1058, partial [Verrucomicrobiota bacterium]
DLKTFFHFPTAHFHRIYNARRVF